MREALGQLLGSGVGVALSPVPIIAVILILGTPRARSAGLSYLAGWLMGLIATVGLVLVLADGASDPSSRSADGAHWATLAIGVALLGLAAQQWRLRPRGDAEPRLPAWMAGIDGFSAGRSFGLGFVLAGLNPKNLALSAAAAIALAEAGPSPSGAVAGVAVLVVVGSSSILVPVLGMLLAPQRVTPILGAAKAWMVRNNATIMFVVFALLGAVKFGEGLGSI